MSFKIIEDTMCIAKNLPSIADAMDEASTYITECIDDISEVQIVNEITDKTEFTWFNRDGKCDVITWE